MKRYLVFILLSILLIQSSSKVLVVAMWWMKKEYIAQNLCINKLKPALHCNGKCYLFQKLKDAEQKQRDQMPDLKNFQEFVLIEPEIISLVCLNLTPDKDSGQFINLELNLSQPHLQKTFNPPEV
ncbi:MAG: hypothetical protein JNK41_00745 [Saprospiraceae bacterium]|jgi:hypothetical protein|nr:hypothetical protein [Saprospiraceae bacterium]